MSIHYMHQKNYPVNRSLKNLVLFTLFECDVATFVHCNLRVVDWPWGFFGKEYEKPVTGGTFITDELYI